MRRLGWIAGALVVMASVALVPLVGSDTAASDAIVTNGAPARAAPSSPTHPPPSAEPVRSPLSPSVGASETAPTTEAAREPVSPVEVRARRRETLDTALQRESRDTAWAARTEQEARGAAAALPGAAAHELVDVTCGSTFCRATIRHHEQGNAREYFLAELTQARPFATRGHLNAEPDGKLTTVYFTRSREHRLPR